MDALVAAFAAAALAEQGDKTQLLVALLAARCGRPVALLAAVAAAAIASSALAAVAGTLIAGAITPRAMTLMVALAFLFAGVTGLMRRGTPAAGSGRTPLLLAAFLLVLAAEMGDRTQFLTFALAGRLDAPLLTAAGASAGIVAASVPAALLGERLGAEVPVRALRLGGAALFLVAALFAVGHALRLG